MSRLIRELDKACQTANLQERTRLKRKKEKEESVRQRAIEITRWRSERKKLLTTAGPSICTRCLQPYRLDETTSQFYLTGDPKYDYLPLLTRCLTCAEKRRKEFIEVEEGKEQEGNSEMDRDMLQAGQTCVHALL
jgi:hypothetical protein